MADEKKTTNEFGWNRDPSFFSKQQMEDQQITYGPDLTWPSMSSPESQDVLNRQRDKVRKISFGQQKAA
jgi:hypothetical protein